MTAISAEGPDFGLTASDYGQYRAGFPPRLVEHLVATNVVRDDDRVLDVGTGTGTLARLLAPRVRSVLGTDPTEQLLEQARALGDEAGNVVYKCGVAEETGLDNESVDLVAAGQCWHWFDADRAAAELLRVLSRGGRLVIAHFDWLPLPGNVVEATEALIIAHNPDWRLGKGSGLYPRWLTDVAVAGFEQIETFSFDVEVPYSHQAWVGRIRASAGVGASLDAAAVERFSDQLSNLLASRFPADSLTVPHRTWAVVARKPV
jgi:SAM-dependent methyltransferase